MSIHPGYDGRIVVSKGHTEDPVVVAEPALASVKPTDLRRAYHDTIEAEIKADPDPVSRDRARQLQVAGE